MLLNVSSRIWSLEGSSRVCRLIGGVVHHVLHVSAADLRALPDGLGMACLVSLVTRKEVGSACTSVKLAARAFDMVDFFIVCAT